MKTNSQPNDEVPIGFKVEPSHLEDKPKKRKGSILKKCKSVGQEFVPNMNEVLRQPADDYILFW